MSLFDRVYEASDSEGTARRILRLYRHPSTSDAEKEAATAAYKRLTGLHPDEAHRVETGQREGLNKFNQMVQQKAARMRAALDRISKLPHQERKEAHRHLFDKGLDSLEKHYPPT